MRISNRLALQEHPHIHFLFIVVRRVSMAQLLPSFLTFLSVGIEDASSGSTDKRSSRRQYLVVPSSDLLRDELNPVLSVYVSGSSGASFAHFIVDASKGQELKSSLRYEVRSFLSKVIDRYTIEFQKEKNSISGQRQERKGYFCYQEKIK